MIRIAKLTDYGIVLMTHFALTSANGACAATGSGAAPAAQNARELARATRLPLPTVGKLLKLLSHAGLLVSSRGKHGGYVLARPAREIALSDVIAAVEGPIAITECGTPGVCEHERGCAVRSNWQIINGAILGALEGLTLADLARPLPRFWPASASAPAGSIPLPNLSRPASAARVESSRS